MAFEKAFKTDKALVVHFDSFINALFNGEAPCELLNPKTTKKQFLKFFAGVEYESFDDFDVFLSELNGLSEILYRVIKLKVVNPIIIKNNLDTEFFVVFDMN